MLCGRVLFWRLEGIAAEWVWRRADPNYENSDPQRVQEKKFARVLFNGDARDAKYRYMAKLTALTNIAYYPAVVSALYLRLPPADETVEATFEQALAFLVLFFVANIFCRAVVYPLASMACAGPAPAVEPVADEEEAE